MGFLKHLPKNKCQENFYDPVFHHVFHRLMLKIYFPIEVSSCVVATNLPQNISVLHFFKTKLESVAKSSCIVSILLTLL